MRGMDLCLFSGLMTSHPVSGSGGGFPPRIDFRFHPTSSPAYFIVFPTANAIPTGNVIPTRNYFFLELTFACPYFSSNLS